jgi:nitrile hydratase accessory protein
MEQGLTKSSPELRLRVLEAVLIENGRVDRVVLETLVNAFGARIEPNARTDLAELVGSDLPAAQVGGAAMLAIPKDAVGPVFRERWEATAFALALALAERGAFSWPEWAEQFGATIQAGSGGPDATYYHYWVATLEHMVASRGLGERVSAAR